MSDTSTEGQSLADPPTPVLLEEGMNAERAARLAIEHLMRPEVQAELRARQRQTDAYFRELRRQMTPTHEQLHRPFTI